MRFLSINKNKHLSFCVRFLPINQNVVWFPNAPYCYLLTHSYFLLKLVPLFVFLLSKRISVKYIFLFKYWRNLNAIYCFNFKYSLSPFCSVPCNLIKSMFNCSAYVRIFSLFYAIIIILISTHMHIDSD